MRRRRLLLLCPLVVAALVTVGVATGGVVDTTPPVITVPADITTPATSPSGAAVDYSASANDDVDGPLTPTCTPLASGETFPAGTTTITCSAIDAAGNTGSAQFNVSVTAYVDDVDPVFGSPSGTTVFDATGTAGQEPVPFTITATDNVDADVAIVCTPPSGSSFPLGSSDVSCTATDDSGNSAQTSFSVTVQDSSAPIVTPPSNVVAEATGPSGAAVTYGQATAVDPPSNSPLQATCSPPSGSTFELGVTNVVCSATDAASQTGTAQFTVTVQDTTPPTVTAPSGLTVQPSGPTGATVTYPDASATDLVGVVSGPTCSPASGSVFPIGTSQVTCTASDGAGNAGTSSFSISVQDAEAPVVTVPASRTVEANGPNGAIVNYETPTAIDLVDGPLAPNLITCSKPSGSVFPLGTTMVTCSATDDGGRTGSAAFTITVVDTTPPVLTVPADLAIQSSSAVPASNSAIQDFLRGATATDIVDQTVAMTHNAPATFPLGTTTVVFTAEDDNGNSTQKSAVVTVTSQPVAPPAAADTTPPDNVRRVKAIAGNLSVAIAWRKPRARDFHHVTITRAPGRNGAPETLVYRGKKKTFVARGLKDGVEYRFVIVAYDEAGNRAAGVAVVVFAEQQNLLVPVNGATISAPRRFAWRPVPGADYYNIQFWHDGKKLSSWPAKPRFTLPGSWRFEGKPHKLVPGTWLVYVWAGFGTKAEAKYGELHVDATFVVRRR